MGLWSAIMRRGRKASDEAAKKIDVDSVTKGKFAIEDSKKEIEDFGRKLAELRASVKGNQRRRDDSQAEIKKLQSLYEKIKFAAGNLKGEDGNATPDKENELERCRKDGAEVIAKIETQEGFVKSATRDIDRDKALSDSMTAQLGKARQRVANAEQNITSLSARQRSAEIRKKFAEAATGFSDGSGLSALDDLERAVEKDEDEASALEDMASVGTSKGIEEKYGGDSSAKVDF